MRFSPITALLAAALAGLSSAYTAPVGASPSGNPISKPGLNEIVPVGKPYTITWAPTTKGTVTLVLLRGPSTNVVPLAPIVEKIPNTGSYSWTPSNSLTADTTHYGIQLIDDTTGAYQYTTQFGISNSAVVSQISDGQVQNPTGVPTSTSTSTIKLTITTSVAASTVTLVTVSASTAPATTSAVSTSALPASSPSASSFNFNSTVVQPSKSMTVPSTLSTALTSFQVVTPSASANAAGTPAVTTPAAPTATGAAAGQKAGNALLALFGVGVLAMVAL